MAATVTPITARKPDRRRLQAQFESALTRAMAAALEAVRQGLPPWPPR
jgi:hypothetical protein